MQLQIKKLQPDAIIPTRTNSTDSGLDLYAIKDEVILHGENKMIDTGIAIALPEPTNFHSGFWLTFVWEAQIRPRSGLAAKHGITVVNSPGTVDFMYRGPIKVILRNEGNVAFQINKGDRIAQMVIAPVITPTIVEVDELSDTDRGENGFGSSGR